MSNIKNFLNKLFNKNKKKSFSKDSYIHSKFIYKGVQLSYYNIMILLDFTEDYFYQVMELLSANCNLTTKLINTSYDVDDAEDYVDNMDVREKSIQKYYLLIGGDKQDYINLYNNISNVSNEALQCITLELYEHTDGIMFQDLIDDGIFNKDLFKNTTKPMTKAINDKELEVIIKYDDIDYIMSQLPSCFLGDDILYFINVSVIPYFNTATFHDKSTLRLLLNNQVYTDYINDDTIKVIFHGAMKNPTREKLKDIFEIPLYKREPSNDILSGQIDEVELDDLFKQEYDRFNAIDSIQYVDIDEVISEEEVDISEEIDENTQY